MFIVTGTYTGDTSGSDREILVDYPFAYLFIKGDSSGAEARFKTPQMNNRQDSAEFADPIAFSTSYIDRFGYDRSTGQHYFRVDSSMNVNLEEYHWFGVVDTGDDDFRTGEYDGNGGDGVAKVSDLPFTPEIVIVKADGAYVAVWRGSCHTGDDSSYFDNDNNASNRIESLDANGFTVGSDAEVNANGVNYVWIAFKASATAITCGTCSGNDTDNRDITTGFASKWVNVSSDSTQQGVFRLDTMDSGDSAEYDNGSAFTTGLIKSFGATTFRVGTDARVNASGTNYYWFAIGAADNSADTEHCFSDDFESGDFSAWTSQTVGSGNTLAVNGGSAQSGSYGLDTTLNNNANDTYTDKTISGFPSNNLRIGFWLKVASRSSETSTNKIMRLLRSAGNSIGSVQLEHTKESFFLVGKYDNDGSTSQSTNHVYIEANAWNWIEFRVREATTNVASDAIMQLYVNGWMMGYLDGFDLFDFRPAANIRLGADLAGSWDVEFYLDGLEVSYDPDTLLGTAEAEPFLTRRFETDNGWSAGVNESGIGTKTINASAALNGSSFGYQCGQTPDLSNNPRIGIDFPEEISAGRDGYAYRFWYDPNNVSLNSALEIWTVASSEHYGISRIQMQASGGDYEIRLRTRGDDGEELNSSYYSFSDAEHKITVITTYASDGTVEDGTSALYIDGVLKETITGINNFDDNNRPDGFVGGIAAGGDVADSGMVYIDEIVIRMDDTDPDAAVIDPMREYPRGVGRGILRGVN